jgi:hypothetical protein
MMLQRLIDHEWTKPFCMALMILGIGALFIGFWAFVNASQQIESNPAYQIKQQSSDQQAPIDQSAALGLMSADRELRELQVNRSRVVVVIGVGVILTALGWLGLDVIRSRRHAVRPSGQHL